MSRSREVFLQGFAPQVDFEGDIAMEHQFRSNALKRRALEIFANYGNLNPPAWAVLAKMFPIRSSYTYLLRLHRFGLLNRERDHRGLLIYAISPRGRERLAWLSGPQSDETILKQHTGDDIWRFNPK